MKCDRLVLLALCAWVVIVLTGLSTRPPMPIDETRCLSVAWEMQSSSDALVPHLNGETYSHKPPLLQWMMLLGWQIFGPVEWWARVVGPLMGLAMLLLSLRLARLLWPAHTDAAPLTVAILGSMVMWCVMASMTMYDALLGACTLVALLGVVQARLHGRARDWALVAAGIGLGLLAKGPVVLLHVLPAALLAPLWDVERHIAARRGGWARWYIALFLALLAGIAVALLWVVPAVIAGGQEYRDAILWGQTAGRMVQSFAHARPWWWYLALAVPLLFPWSLWPPLWRGLRQHWRVLAADSGARLAVTWFAASFLVLSLTSGKQVHYLIPIYPAFALLLARLLSAMQLRPRDTMLPALVLASVIGACTVALWMQPAFVPAVAKDARAWCAVPFVVFALFAAFARATNPRRAVATMLLLGCGITISAHVVAEPALMAAYDVRPAAAVLADAAKRGDAIGWIGTYHGEVNYFARLHEPIQELTIATVGPWLAAHPQASVVLVGKQAEAKDVRPNHRQLWRGGMLEVWDGTVLATHPEVLQR